MKQKAFSKRNLGGDEVRLLILSLTSQFVSTESFNTVSTVEDFRLKPELEGALSSPTCCSVAGSQNSPAALKSKCNFLFFFPRKFEPISVHNLPSEIHATV